MTLMHAAIPLLTTLCIAGASLHAQSPAAADVKKALAAAEAVYLKIKVPLTCTVVDMNGEIVAMQRGDGAKAFTTRISHGKARATAAFGQPSGALTRMSSMGLDKAVGEPAFFLQGAVPLTRNGQQVGAIGCSGGTGQQDEDAANAGAAAF